MKPTDEQAAAYAVRAADEPERGSVVVANLEIKSLNMHCSQAVIDVTVVDVHRQESLVQLLI